MKPDKLRVPTASRRDGDTLIEIVYDSTTGKTALVVSVDGKWSLQPEVEISTGERLIPYAGNNNLIRHGSMMLPSEPIEHGGKDELLAAIEAYLHRYIDFSPLFERIAAHYALLTWVHDAFNELPYLRFKGEYGSGKTRALLALGSVAYRGFFASGASTVSPIFHALDAFGGTLLLDEGDLRFSGKTADLVKILNNGTVKGMPVLRTVQNRDKQFSPAAFQVFGPKIVAMRGTFRDPALESRFITEDMGERPLRNDIPIQLPDSLRAEALILRNRLLHFRLTNLPAIESDPARIIPGLAPRFNQTALSLLSIVDDLTLRTEIADLLHETQAELARHQSKEILSRTIAVIRAVLGEPGRRIVSLREIADRINAIGVTPGAAVSPRQVGRVLRELSIPLHKSHGTASVSAGSFAAFEATNSNNVPGYNCSLHAPQ